jgi:hypothetical protein
MARWLHKYNGGFAAQGGIVNFNLHPMLMTVGWLAGCSEGGCHSLTWDQLTVSTALMAYHAFPLSNMSHGLSKLAHFGLHCVTFALITAALAVAFRNHDENHVPNVASTHEFMGVLSQYPLTHLSASSLPQPTPCT